MRQIQLYFDAKSQADLAADKAADIARIPTVFTICEYCSTPIPAGFEIRHEVEVWKYDEYDPSFCFSTIETDVICERCSRG